nr:hypothetical protein [Streptomyces sp. MH191]
MGGVVGSSGDSGPVVVAQTVDSVGPYALTSRRPADQPAARFRGSASPAVTRVVSEGRLSGSMSASAAGGSVAWVTPRSATRRTSAGPGISSGDGADTRQAPLHSAITVSHTDASKLIDANCRTRLPGESARCSACSAARLGSPRWVTVTPLGRPVEPEVWTT